MKSPLEDRSALRFVLDSSARARKAAESVVRHFAASAGLAMNRQQDLVDSFSEAATSLSSLSTRSAQSTKTGGGADGSIECFIEAGTEEVRLTIIPGVDPRDARKRKAVDFSRRPWPGIEGRVSELRIRQAGGTPEVLIVQTNG